MKTVSEVLKGKDKQNQEVHTIEWDHTVFEALVVMSSKNVGALPVVKQGEVVGIISERDYARKLILKGLSSVTTKVHEVMSSPVITVDAHKTVEECMNIMTDSHLLNLIKQLEQYIRG